MIALKANNLIKIYGGNNKSNSTNALNGIDLKINEGEFVGIMGPSGSGKTTLLNVLSGLNKPTNGDIEIEGLSICSMKKDQLALFRRNKLGYVFQNFNLLDSLTLKENIMLPMILSKKKISEIESQTNHILDLLGIKDIADKYTYNVSGGQQQRAAIGRALANNPAMIFADEPTGNLDSKASKNVMEYLEKLNVEFGRTVLMVTHDALSASYCNRIIFIKDGQISTEIIKKEGRKDFFDRILDCLALIGGEAV